MFERPWPASVGDAGAQHKRIRVVLASRPPRRRAVLNEPDIVAHLVKHWDVNVTLTRFDMGLAGAVALMQETDVLIGMHGAGASVVSLCLCTHPSAAALLQLKPTANTSVTCLSNPP